jgi:F-type H+-transporting ATPase subunit b
VSELIHNFGIDWRLLLAQAVNFLILLWILKRYAYGPILRLLHKRKEEIAKGMEFTQEAKKRLMRVEEERNEILIQSRQEALSIVREAENLAKKRKEEILKEATQKSETVVLEAKRVIGEEKAKMKEEVYKEAEELIRLGISKVLGKMPAEEKDKELIKEAFRELKSIA